MTSAPVPLYTTPEYVFQHIAGRTNGAGVFAGLVVVDRPVIAHRHDFYEIAFVMGGSGHHEDAQGRMPILSGDVWIVRPGQWHAFPLAGHALSVFNLLISREFARLHDDALQTTTCLGLQSVAPVRHDRIVPALSVPFTMTMPHLRLSPNGLERVRTLLIALAAELDTPAAAGHAALCAGLVLQILGLLDRYGRSGPAQSAGTLVARDDPGVLAVVHYIEEHFAESLTLSELATQSGYAPTYLVRKFRQRLGAPPIDYLIQVRLQHACALLETTDRPVTTIAHDVGFCDSRYFATRFRRVLHQTPTQYRAATRRQDHKHGG